MNMSRKTGEYRINDYGGEKVRAFVPFPLPPSDPPLELNDQSQRLLAAAETSLARLSVAAAMVPSEDWFLYGFLRKEAVITSQIEGTQATLQDVLTFEVTKKTDRPEDVREVCNYVDAVTYARREMRRPKGLAAWHATLVRSAQTIDAGDSWSGEAPR